ncbi:MAG TPA: hypothetical protein VGI81_00945 [Tepidisphaeraceae bacterium]|jgi:hypothetical protein
MTGDANDLTVTTATETPAAIPYADPLVPTARETGLTSGITRGDVAALAVRLFGIYLLLNALTIIGYFVSFAVQVPRFWSRADSGFILYSIYLMGYAGFGAWFTLKAVRIAAWLLPPVTANPNVPTASGSSHGLQAVAFSIVGAYLALSALPELAATFAWRGAAMPGGTFFPPLIKAGVQFAAGLFLFFRAKRISAYWQRLEVARPKGADDDSGPL